MEMIKKTLGFGYPIKVYQFTGKFQGVLHGFYKSARNKGLMFAPIYIDYEGNRIVDMTQAREEGEICQTSISR